MSQYIKGNVSNIPIPLKIQRMNPDSEIWVSWDQYRIPEWFWYNAEKIKKYVEKSDGFPADCWVKTENGWLKTGIDNKGRLFKDRIVSFAQPNW